MSTRSRKSAANPHPITLGVAQPAPAFDIITHTIEVNRHSVYISDEIQGPSEYIDLVHELRAAAPHDEFTIYLNTDGGRVNAGLQLINAMWDSPATVTTVLDPQAYSMGAFIFLAGDIQVVPDNAQLMLHHYSSGLLGKGNEQLAEVRAASRNFEKLFKSICHPFLTMEEITNIMNGQDLWLDADDIRRRLKRLAKAAEETATAQASAKPPRPRRKPLTVEPPPAPVEA